MHCSVLIVAGPTASGKSALALAIAERLGGTVINADSMQVYRELRVLTARPTPQDETRVPHLLYGVRPAAEAGSVAWWRQAALAAIDQARQASRLPILTGGTGLYFAALTQGLVDIPDPGDAARAEARHLLATEGAAALHARLQRADPVTAGRLHPADSQRIARAWEVWRGTGRSLTDWQAQRSVPAFEELGYDVTAVLLDPPRDDLRAAIAGRFQAMLRDGAIAEVQSLMAKNLNPSLPAMRAHGVPELSAYLRGDIDLAEAGRRTELVTGQYTKRQATWFRHHTLAAQTRIRKIKTRIDGSEQLSEQDFADLVTFIQTPG